MDVVLVRKLRAPYMPEVAIGAVDESGKTYLAPYAQDMGADWDYLQAEKKTQLAVLQHRRQEYNAIRPPVAIAGRTVIIIDDGLATGATMVFPGEGFDAKATLLAGAKGGAMGALGSAAGLVGGSGLKALGSSALKVASNPVGAALNVGKAQLGIGGGGNAAPSLLTANISADGVIPAAANAVGQGAGRSVLGTIGNAIGGVQGAMDLGLGGLSAYQGYKAQQKADKLQGQALDLAKARDAELAPMRQAAIQKLMAAQRPDLSSDFASANPFARPLKRLG
mgnify:CR=1 FL=1